MNAQTIPDTAKGFGKQLEQVDRNLRPTGVTVPSTEIKEQVAKAFWSLLALIDRYNEVHRGTPEAATVQQVCRAIVGGWLDRCRCFNRAFHKPHGYAGDYRMVEWMCPPPRLPKPCRQRPWRNCNNSSSLRRRHNHRHPDGSRRPVWRHNRAVVEGNQS